ncbi:20213_t:CDS:2, partial [Rhizophagus irregularis]
GAWGIEPPFLTCFLKNGSKELTFSRGMSAIANASIRSSISWFFDSEAARVDERWLSTTDLCFHSTETL